VRASGARLLRPYDAATLLLTPPAGVSGRDYLAAVVALADDAYATLGWDQPLRLFAVVPLSARPKKSRDKIAANARADGVQFDPATAITVAEVPTPGEGTPLDLLGGARVPGWVGTLILHTEAWASPAPGEDGMDPAAGLAPSAHPSRQEMRMTLAVARDGYTLTAQTPRGGQTRLSVGDASAYSYGRATDLLLRLMGAPTPPSAFHPGHLLAAHLITSLADYATAVGHKLGTPRVRAIAQHMDELDDEARSASPPDGFGELGDANLSHLLSDAVAAADHPDEPHAGPYTPGDWADTAAMWAYFAAHDPDDSWMDAGIFARQAAADAMGGATAEDFLGTLGAVFGKADAGLLRTGLGALGVLGWPSVDLADLASTIDPP